MNDEQLEYILEAFKLNNNDCVLDTKSFHLKSDHNLFCVSFFVNDSYWIIREKGKDKIIVVNKNIDVEKLINEIKEKITSLKN
jgi:hypothetical protein